MIETHKDTDETKINNMKVPYIQYDQDKWEFIKSTLEKIGYSFKYISDWGSCPYLLLDFGGQIGTCSNLPKNLITQINRYEVYNIDEFLKKAKILFNDKILFNNQDNQQQMNTIDEIKEITPGMVLTTKGDMNWVAFPTELGMGIICYDTNQWYLLDKFIQIHGDEILNIRDISKGTSLIDGEVIWEKPKEIVIKLQEIADKFNVPANLIRIEK